ncbi:hypothetical protein [Arthrobacter livingstonensis]|uniref:hypothetical protein n=1 Tax=Arthrobacter livingstonensis TaxID=670078 RepID=UPI001FE35FB1|nr:hypothetical protein [Arthrobacter livingstonensis]
MPRVCWLAVDIPGIVLFAGTVTGLLVFLSGLASPRWWLAGIALVLGATLIIWERHAHQPLIDVRMLGRNRPLQRTYVRQLIVGLGTYTALYGTSQWMEQSAGLGPSVVGLVLLPLSGVSIVIARVVSARGWVRIPLALAGAALILTAVMMMAITHDSGIPVIVGMTLLFGFCNGFSGFANQAALYVQTSSGDIAVASGLFRTFSYIGAIFSASLISLTFGQAARDSGFHTLAWVIGGIGIAVLLLTVLDKSIPSIANAGAT